MLDLEGIASIEPVSLILSKNIGGNRDSKGMERIFIFLGEFVEDGDQK